MKHLMTLVALFGSFVLMAQNPNYNPDANGDNIISVSDLTSFLANYGNSFFPSYFEGLVSLVPSNYNSGNWVENAGATHMDWPVYSSYGNAANGVVVDLTSVGLFEHDYNVTFSNYLEISDQSIEEMLALAESTGFPDGFTIVVISDRNVFYPNPLRVTLYSYGGWPQAFYHEQVSTLDILPSPPSAPNSDHVWYQLYDEDSEEFIVESTSLEVSSIQRKITQFIRFRGSWVTLEYE